MKRELRAEGQAAEGATGECFARAYGIVTVRVALLVKPETAEA
jgi:hypothetical protein